MAEGVTLTQIVRGTEPAPPAQINTTTRGPWVVNMLTIDPRVAEGYLEATYGPALGQVERTTALVEMSGALAGVNASFFTFSANPQFPGDPVGLGLFDGKLLSEPGPDGNEADFVVSARSDRVLMGPLDWTGVVRNQQTEAELPLEFVNHPPVVPAGCVSRPDQTTCTLPGDLVRFTPEFGTSTPAGNGVEVFDEDGDQVATRPGLFGVNGRYRLTANGEIVVPDGSGSFFDRNPRTIAGTTRDGRIVLATIDGRQTTSVGTTMDETAAVADALGMYDAVNLDGGGSTAMAVEGELVNRPSGATERAVGDALVYVEGP